MADRPILFSAPMVRALLREIEAPGIGKTQTRRVMNPQPSGLARVERISGTLKIWTIYPESNRCTVDFKPPKIATGDRLWVRESWNSSGMNWGKPIRDMRAGLGGIHYAATDDGGWKPYWGGWRPSIHMPRWASRITLLVTEVRVERLQDCSEADAVAEGITMILEDGPLDAWFSGTRSTCDFTDQDLHGWHHNDARAAYADLWDQINGTGAWAANPWVAAYTFRPILGNIDQIGEAC